MWLAIKESILKEAAGRVKDPADKLLVNELGVQGAIRYRRLLDRFPASEAPEAQRGPDETISDHASRLEKRLKDELAAGQSEREQAREQGRLKPQTTIEETQQAPVTMPWVGDLPTGNVPAAPSDLGGMPRRIPNQFTTGNPEFGTKPFPGWEVPPANQPLHTAPRTPMRAPEPQSMQDWVNFLRGKGITVNHQLMRPDAVQMQGPMPQGQDIWKDFVGPTTTDSMHQYLKDQPAGPNTFGKSLTQRVKDLFNGRRVRASTVVTEYISGVLTGEVLPKIAAAGDSYEDHVAKFNARQKMMKDEGWNFHESGSGNWWEHPETGHKIMYDTARDRDGNIQEGYTHQKPGGIPTFYPSLHEALLASKVGSLGHISVKPPLGPRLNAA